MENNKNRNFCQLGIAGQNHLSRRDTKVTMVLCIIESMDEVSDEYTSELLL